jgi:hypothetical protein
MESLELAVIMRALENGKKARMPKGKSPLDEWTIGASYSSTNKEN